MSKEAIQYLRENKDRYEKNVLIKSLRKAGYKESDIQESLREVYGTNQPNKNKQNSAENGNGKNYKNIRTAWQKVKDFLLGLFILGILFIVQAFFSFFSFYYIDLFDSHFQNILLGKIIAALMFLAASYFFIKKYYHRRPICAYVLILGSISVGIYIFTTMSRFLKYYF